MDIHYGTLSLMDTLDGYMADGRGWIPLTLIAGRQIGCWMSTMSRCLMDCICLRRRRRRRIIFSLLIMRHRQHHQSKYLLQSGLLGVAPSRGCNTRVSTYPNPVGWVWLLTGDAKMDTILLTMSLRCGCSSLWLDKKDKSYVCLSLLLYDVQCPCRKLNIEVIY
jgi:hypothetical protein